jgi:hypothetical protein
MGVPRAGELFRDDSSVIRIPVQGGLGQYCADSGEINRKDIFAGPTRPAQWVGSVRLLRQNPLDTHRLRTSR